MEINKGAISLLNGTKIITYRINNSIFFKKAFQNAQLNPGSLSNRLVAYGILTGRKPMLKLEYMV